jgi:hypothetical protein
MRLVEKFAFGSDEQKFLTMLTDQKFDEGCDRFKGALVYNNDYPAAVKND